MCLPVTCSFLILVFSSDCCDKDDEHQRCPSVGFVAVFSVVLLSLGGGGLFSTVCPCMQVPDKRKTCRFSTLQESMLSEE